MRVLALKFFLMTEVVHEFCARFDNFKMLNNCYANNCDYEVIVVIVRKSLLTPIYFYIIKPPPVPEID